MLPWSIMKMLFHFCSHLTFAHHLWTSLIHPKFNIHTIINRFSNFPKISALKKSFHLIKNFEANIHPPCSQCSFYIHNKRIKESKRLHYCNRNKIKWKKIIRCAERIQSDVISSRDISLGIVVIRFLIKLFWFSSFVPNRGNFRYRELISLSAEHARSYERTVRSWERKKKVLLTLFLEVGWCSYLKICICTQRSFAFFASSFLVHSLIHSFIHLFVRFLSQPFANPAKSYFSQFQWLT